MGKLLILISGILSCSPLTPQLACYGRKRRMFLCSGILVKIIGCVARNLVMVVPQENYFRFPNSSLATFGLVSWNLVLTMYSILRSSRIFISICKILPRIKRCMENPSLEGMRLSSRQCVTRILLLYWSDWHHSFLDTLPFICQPFISLYLVLFELALISSWVLIGGHWMAFRLRGFAAGPLSFQMRRSGHLIMIQ